jgi:dolichol-phosphate mannosyltransferase
MRALGRLAIVCPMANEIETAERFVREILAVASRPDFPKVEMFVILDRVSRDGTLERLRALEPGLSGLRVVYAPENRGVVDAYGRGYREALASGADWILEIDAGYSHQPAEAPRFFEAAAAGAECVFATRFSLGGRFVGGFGKRYFVSRLGGLLARMLLGGGLSDMTSGYQFFSRRALETALAPGLMSRGPFFQTEMKHHTRNLPRAQVPITYVPTAQAVRPTALSDALSVLFRLFWRRVTGWAR